MTSLRMDKRFTCTYFLVMLSGNTRKWLKALRSDNMLGLKHVYYDRCMLAMINVPGYEDFLIAGVIAQGLLPDPFVKEDAGDGSSIKRRA